MAFTLTISDLTGAMAEARECALEEFDALAVGRNETDGGKALWEVVAYFAGEEQALRAASRLPASDDIKIALLPDTDWVRRSLEGLAPVAAGRFFLHGSHDRSKCRPGGVSLEIDAGTAFGTGHHPTTLGCLLALDALLKQAKPSRILDIGCGTGVLTLAAAKALRKPVLAIDIDPEAVRVARTNARRNDASPLLRAVTADGIRCRQIRAGARYDLILANILAGPLIALARPVSRVLAPGGALILSGITDDQSRAVLAAYRNRDILPVRMISLHSWRTLVLARSPLLHRWPELPPQKPNTRSIAAPGVE